MTHTAMLDSYPKDVGSIDKDKLTECMAACFECAQVCTACADACLSEDMVADLITCIRTNLDCADICHATGNALSQAHRLTTLTSHAPCLRPVSRAGSDGGSHSTEG